MRTSALARSCCTSIAPPDALAEYCKAFELDPGQYRILNYIGAALLAQGKFDEAAASFRRYLAQCPESEFGCGYRSLVSTGRVAAAPSDCQRLTAILHDPNSPIDNRVAAGFALGKLLDDSGRFDEAFGCFADANSLWKEHRAAAGDRYRPEAVHRDVDQLVAAFDRKCFQDGRDNGESSELPVFIVGMPRSGTTLVHQIVTSHPQGHGIGERTDISEIAIALNNSATWGDVHALKAAASRHLQRLRAINATASRIFDKTPGNSHWLGLIALLFPQARVICCRRDAPDTCLSCYFQWFSQGNLFSFDLAHCGLEYLEVDRLMNHWLRHAAAHDARGSVRNTGDGFGGAKPAADRFPRPAVGPGLHSIPSGGNDGADFKRLAGPSTDLPKFRRPLASL